MVRKSEQELRDQLVALRTEHRDLDSQIIAREQSSISDQLTVRRLKKRKLMVKDQIQTIEDQLLPDIIA